MKSRKKEFRLPTFHKSTEIICEIEKYQSEYDPEDLPVYVLSFGDFYSIELCPRDVEILIDQLSFIRDSRMWYTDKISEACKNCGSSNKWMIESHMEFVPGCGVVVTCGDCYDGAPDSGYDIGRGSNLQEALADWQSQWEEYDEVVSCPGCGCMPGDGITSDCYHVDGCGYWKGTFEWEDLSE